MSGPSGRGDHTMLKLILLGECGVGKTAILNRLCDGRFVRNAQATIGVDFKFRDYDLDSYGRVRLHCWDTAGADAYRSISKPYYRQSDGVVIVYDVCAPGSMAHVLEHLNEARELCPLGVVVALFGNKTDLRDEAAASGSETVSREAGEQLARRSGIPIFFETSAASGTNIEESFEVLAKHILNNRNTNSTLRDINGGSEGINGGGSRRSGVAGGAPLKLRRRDDDDDDRNKRKDGKCGKC